MVRRPTAAASAASDPEMQENSPQPITVEVPKPERKLPKVASATLSSLMPRPLRTIASPVRMNSGIAISAKESTPSNSASPTSVSGSTPVDASIVDRAEPHGDPERHAQHEQQAEQQDRADDHRHSSNMDLPAQGGAAGGEVGEVALQRLQAAEHDQREADRHRGLEPGLVDAQHRRRALELEQLRDRVHRPPERDDGEDDGGDLGEGVEQRRAAGPAHAPDHDVEADVRALLDRVGRRRRSPGR